jgi:dTDP-4-dehydrorhamnose 3,5-epimerase
MAIKVRELGLPGVVEIVPDRFADERGFFSETYNAERFAAAGIDTRWVQDNQSLSAAANTLRGLHLQLAPMRQAKLVRVLRGSALDAIVDVRPSSPSFRRWVAVELSASAWNQVYVPAGYAHGFLTREPQTELLYKVSAPYSPEHELTIRYDDPELSIEWGLAGAVPTLSKRDAAAPSLRDLLARGDLQSA